MRRSPIVAALAMLALTSCSGHVLVTEGEPQPALPHPVLGPLASLGIPPGHYPPPGQCRVWIPRQPPGHQPAALPCHALGEIPLGAWVLYRPTHDKKVVEVTAYHHVEPQVVVSVSYYDVNTGALVRVQGVN